VSTRLFLVRHGDASPGEAGHRDDLRSLTPKGRRQIHELRRALKRLDVVFDRLHHSPLLRAVETAELLTGRLDGVTVVDPRLAGGPDLELLAALQGERVALVGHQPHLGELASMLIFGWKPIERPQDLGPLSIETGALCLLEGEPRPGGMRLRGLYSPRALKELSDA
jgi:phosphohistidine phosphatase